MIVAGRDVAVRAREGGRDGHDETGRCDRLALACRTSDAPPDDQIYVLCTLRRRDRPRSGALVCSFFFQAEDRIRDWSVTGVPACALFFQAEDGIRDWSVTGVQTCA